jgi:GNAT superfamily N-acetyltransferase
VTRSRVAPDDGVRPADAGGRDIVFDLARAFATSFSVERAAFEESWERLRRAPDATLLVATRAQRPSGYLLGFHHDTFFANGPVSWIEELTIQSELRGQGLGRLLVEAFAQEAQRRRSRLIALATRRADAFYAQLGYEESAVYYRRVLS